MTRAELIRLFATGFADGTGAAAAGTGGGTGASAAAGASEDDGDEPEAGDEGGDAGDAGDGKKPKQLSEEDRIKSENQTLRTAKKVYGKVSGFKDLQEAEDYKHKLGGRTMKQVVDEHLELISKKKAKVAGAASTGQTDAGDGEGHTSAAEELLRRQNEEKDHRIRDLENEIQQGKLNSVEDTAKMKLRGIAAEVGIKAKRLDVALRYLGDFLVRDPETNELERDADGNFLIWRVDPRTQKRVPDALSVDSLRLIAESDLKELMEPQGSGGSGGSARGEARTTSDPSKGLFERDANGNVVVNTTEYRKLDDGAQRGLQRDIQKAAR